MSIFTKTKQRLRRRNLSKLGIDPSTNNYSALFGGDHGWVVDTSRISKDSIIYSVGVGANIDFDLALINKLSKSHQCNLFIGVGKKIEGAYFKHPANGVYIDNRIANQILPLLKFQPFLNEVKIHSEEKIDINLDLFRDLPISLNFNSCKWYFHLTGTHVDLSTPYLNSTEHKSVRDKIVILRTFRYRNHFINYEFLNKFDENIIFIGLKEEFEDLRKDIPKLQHYEPENFFEMSQIIKSSKFFLGNQSPAFAIAEALKVPRLLECSPDFTVVQPIGGDCYDFYFQIHFEKWFKKLCK